MGAGYVASLARPGGNVTGFTISNTASGAKWVELLKEIAPRVTRAAIIRDTWQFRRDLAISGAIQIRGTVPRGGDEHDRQRDARDILSITTFARTPNGGLIVSSPIPGSSIVS